MQTITQEVAFEYTDMDGNHVVIARVMDKLVRYVIAPGFHVVQSVDIIGLNETKS